MKGDEIWEKKKKLFQIAIKGLGLTVALDNLDEAEVFYNMLKTFRRTVRSNKIKYSDEWAYVRQFTISRKDCKVRLTLRKPLNQGEKLLIKVVDGLQSQLSVV